jgi:hypothetical protein
MAFFSVFVVFGVLAWIGAVGIVGISKKPDEEQPPPSSAFKLDRAGTISVAMLGAFWGPVLLFVAAHVILQLPYSEQTSTLVASCVLWLGLPLTVIAGFILIRKVAHWAANRVRDLAK